MQKLTLAALAAIAVVLSAPLLVLSVATPAEAKIREVPTECTNPSGATPNGQQPECKNENLTQETENQNPAGHAPGGHNK